MKLELLHQPPKEPKKGKSPILFLHGAWHGAWCWQKHFMPYFAQHGYETYAMSLRGHGNSPKDKAINAHSMGDYVHDLKQVVDSMERPPIIVAHSLGGFILQKYLEKYTCAGGVLLASVPPQGVLRFSLKLIFTKHYAISNLLRLNLGGLVTKNRRTRWAFFSDDLPEEAVSEYTSLMNGESFKAFLSLLVPRIKLNYHTKIPLFVLGAENDQIFTVKENHQTAKKYKAPVKIIQGMAHDMMLDTQHQQAADVILEWLEEI